MKRCPPPEMLFAESSGALPDELAGRVRAHAGECVFCQTLLRDAEDADAAAPRDRVWAKLRPQVTPRRSWFDGPAFAPAFALAASLFIAGVVAWRWHTFTDAVPPPVEVAAIPARPLRLPFEKPPLRLPASAVVAWRGADAPPDSPLAGAARAYAAGDFAAAEREFAKSNLAEARYYRAVSLLMLDRAADAVPLLDGLAAKDLNAEIAWTLAVARSKSGDGAGARAAVASICANPGPYQVRACQALQ